MFFGLKLLRFVIGSVAGSAPGDGVYYFAMKSQSANGQSTNTNYYGPVRLTTAVPGAPTITARGGV